MGKNITIHGIGKRSDETISFFATSEKIQSDYDEYERFIKRCEYLVRNDIRYASYINKLKSSGLNFCAVLGNLSDDDGVSIEMHHGPILNLFDICDIVTRALLSRGDETITTFKIADLVLTEHENDNIMIVMLCKTAHRSSHTESGPFIHIKSTIGKLECFLENYHEGLRKSHKKAIQKYIENCKESDGTIDNGFMDTSDRLLSFK